MHPIDRIGGAIVRYGPDRLRFFDKGWGDRDIIESTSVETGEVRTVDLEWISDSANDGIITSVGIFDSPVSHLPDHSRHAAVTRIEPAGGTDRMVVMMAAWNEHDSRARFGIARRLARRGIGSLVLENPFYGVRRPPNVEGQPIRTVSDFFLMGIGAVAEGRSLVATVRDDGYVPGVSGYSMGGNIAALISSTMPFDVATAPLAASYSPSPVYLDGVLRGGIAWDALGGEARAEQPLRDTLLRASVLDRPAPPHARHAVIVAARSDGYVPPSATRALGEHWLGSELRWLRGGHATLLWFHKHALAQAIEASFERLLGRSRDEVSR